MKIKKIIKDFDAFPIRWIATLVDDTEITIRERGLVCVVYKTVKSVFEVLDDDILVQFKVEESADDKTLILALEHLHAHILPDAEFDEQVKSIIHQYNPYQRNRKIRKLDE